MSVNPITSFDSSSLYAFMSDRIVPTGSSQRIEHLEQSPHVHDAGAPAFFGDLTEALARDGNYRLRVSLFEVDLQVQRSLQSANGQVLTERAELAFSYFEANFGSAVEGLENEVPFTGDFTPEATAGRIRDFALSMFGTGVGNHTTEDTPESRREYVDYILPAIQKGFDEARAILGALAPEVENGTNRTWTQIQEALDRFTGEAVKA